MRGEMPAVARSIVHDEMDHESLGADVVGQALLAPV
jgi:hypothetical protein